ncbi:MAG TPA: glycoside hydrolase family 2 TIM barrel-domain containing protein [Planctomycetaceae bacterium]|nr:glycoside hydrolase family 2 TIM barrel-domain containing protein [Planctomycetaceae bacterium]
MRSLIITACLFSLASGSGLFDRTPLHSAEWQPKTAPLMTRWAKDVTPDKVHPEYPRPQLVREHWLNLNGLWDYAITDKDAKPPSQWDGSILVPFPVESALSGVMKSVGPDQTLWYRRTFSVPQNAAWNQKNVLLHFGAVDWDTTVWINGKEVAKHRGGFDPFSADITAHLKSDGDNELMVSVFDPSDAGHQPRGKQVQKPHGIWYTPTTGIWQTVWLEPVPKTYIRGVTFTPDIDADTATMQLDIAGSDAIKVGVKQTYMNDGIRFDATFTLPVSNTPLGLDSSPEYRKVLWTPETPILMDVELSLLGDGDRPLEVVSTYYARRKISLGKDDKGVTRILLNNKPLFQYGTLDQGFWPDGLYTAPTDAAMKSDIEITKQYGFNMIRKHVKVEPARWYHYCDQLGMIVWQDMPSGDKHAQWDPFGKFDGQEFQRSEESALNFREEWKHIIDSRRNFPSIVMWVPFNEGWGQSDTVAVTKWTKEYDPTRLVNCASGGNDFPVGDVIDVHRYPGPFAPRPEEHRAAVLGEYGGLGLPVKRHTWQDEKNWGYRSFSSQEALTEAYLDLIDTLQPMIGRDGLSAAIYTQTTDVEIEVNGLLTYDRAVEKLPVKTLAEAHKKLWQPTVKVTTTPVLPTALVTPADWKYSLEKPADGWFKPDFDDSSWKTGKAGFGEPSTPGSKVNTNWKSPDIWLRREFTVTELPKGELRLRAHHDEDAEIYLNGILLKRVVGYTTAYQSYRIPADAAKALKAGINIIAVHCHQTGGGQYIDIGLDAITPTP